VELAFTFAAAAGVVASLIVELRLFAPRREAHLAASSAIMR
jgi:hypothetical protein